ncbi:hypothetical protein EVAR_42974_1 [Eumeta japonica]|uniref:Uncharacterized protein n=1 Tax=Eumeta variegata TaxID=151549 RepID=A0A4C1ZUI0_EUMVA|nr:hypothetical protein EVAR_42974_1 [Eumeta japonica]
MSLGILGETYHGVFRAVGPLEMEFLPWSGDIVGLYVILKELYQRTDSQNLCPRQRMSRPRKSDLYIDSAPEAVAREVLLCRWDAANIWAHAAPQIRQYHLCQGINVNPPVRLPFERLRPGRLVIYARVATTRHARHVLQQTQRRPALLAPRAGEGDMTQWDVEYQISYMKQAVCALVLDVSLESRLVCGALHKNMSRLTILSGEWQCMVYLGGPRKSGDRRMLVLD